MWEVQKRIVQQRCRLGVCLYHALHLQDMAYMSQCPEETQKQHDRIICPAPLA
jgi:hypothetical protein